MDREAYAAGAAALAGVLATVDELAMTGLLDSAALGRINAIMAASIAQSGAASGMQDVLRAAIADHIAHRQRQLGG